MKKLTSVTVGSAFLLLGSALPLVAQGPSSPPLPTNGGRLPVATPVVVSTPTPPMAAPTPTPTPVGRITVTAPTPDASPVASGTLPAPTATPGGPVTPSPEAVRVQGQQVSNLRRLIRDVQSNTDNVKAVGNFGAQLYLVADETFFQDWKKPETPTVSPVQLALRGQILYTVIIFYGPAQDNKGLSNVSYDLTVRRPDGTVYTERKSLIGWQNLAPDERELQLGRNYIGINLAPNDPAGLYTVEALIHDNVGRVDLPLKQTFAVQ